MIKHFHKVFSAVVASLSLSRARGRKELTGAHRRLILPSSSSCFLSGRGENPKEKKSFLFKQAKKKDFFTRTQSSCNARKPKSKQSLPEAEMGINPSHNIFPLRVWPSWPHLLPPLLLLGMNLHFSPRPFVIEEVKLPLHNLAFFSALEKKSSFGTVHCRTQQQIRRSRAPLPKKILGH